MNSFIVEITPAVIGFGLLFLIAILLSSYVKVATVLSILRIGFGFTGVPSAAITAGLALSLTMLIMAPVIQDTLSAVQAELKLKNEKSFQSLGEVEKSEVIAAGLAKWRIFLETRTPEQERVKFRALEAKLNHNQAPALAVEKPQESWSVLAPSFLVLELRSAFSIGLTIFLPLLLIDLVVTTLLASLGVESISTNVISFPIKLALFVALDGWGLITTNLVESYITK
jgi:type III secretory pathway component EscR